MNAIIAGYNPGFKVYKNHRPKEKNINLRFGVLWPWCSIRNILLPLTFAPFLENKKAGNMDVSDTTESNITTSVYTSGVDIQTPNPKIMEIFTQVVATIPQGRQPEILKLLEKFATQAQHQPSRPLPADQSQMKDWSMKTYPQYKTHMKTVDKSLWSNGKECLKQNWGIYLKKFNPKLDRDYMSQADLLDLDPKLLTRLRDTHTAEELGEFLPSLPALNKQIASALSVDEKREAYRIMALLSRSLENNELAAA